MTVELDQGAWDAITGLKNELGRAAIHEDRPTRAEYEALLARVVELERRFKEMKKGVWRA